MPDSKSQTTSDNPFEPLCSRCNDTHRIAVHSLRMPPFGTMPNVGTPQASGTDIEISYAPCPECRAQEAMTDPKTTARPCNRFCADWPKCACGTPDAPTDPDCPRCRGGGCEWCGNTGRAKVPRFNATRQCCWCGNDNRKGEPGYAGERGCPTCGWGGNGEPDVPCMFYKIIRERADAR